MHQLTSKQLLSLESYAKVRASVRTIMIDYKKQRQFYLGKHARVCFEDQTTVQYQVQEMLRVERIFEADAIEEELEAYNPLIPEGSNLKATLMLEYPDVEERKQALARLVGIEDLVWIQMSGFDKVYAIANEDLQRSTADKTSAVHFLRFELSQKMIDSFCLESKIFMGIDHPNYSISSVSIPLPIVKSLIADLSPEIHPTIFETILG